MPVNRFSSRILIAVAPIFALQAPVAVSQETSSPQGLQEVTVTARKRVESLQEVPISVTAFTAERLQQLDLTDLTDIQRFTPGLSFEQSAFNASFRYLPQIRFRGMSTNAPQPNSQVGAVFLDGVFIVGGAQSMSTEDVERVEVLKGPQNTYFGRNTFAGAINFITRTPTKEFSAEARLKVEQRDTYNVSGSVEGPLFGDKVSGRLIVGKWQDGAHYRSGDGGDIGRQQTQFVTGTLQLNPLEGLQIKLRGHYQEDSDYGNANFPLRTQADFANCRPNLLNWLCGGAPSVGDSAPLLSGATRVVPASGLWQDTSLQPAQLLAVGRGSALSDWLANTNGIMNDIPFFGDVPKLDHFGGERRIERVTASWSYEFDGGMTLAGNAGYSETLFAGLTDSDSTLGNLAGVAAPVFLYVPFRTDDLTAEVRLVSPQESRLRWLVGASTFKIRFDGSTGSGVKALNARTGLASTNAWQNSDRDRSEVSGVFAALSYDLLPTLTGDLEVRYQKDQLKAFQQTAPGTFLPIFRTFNDVLPRAILSWKPTPETNLYASWSRGALPGLANTTFQNLVNTIAAFPANPVGSTDPDVIRAQLSGLLGVNVPLTLESEQADQIEIGWKQQFLQGRAFANFAIYQIEWQNQKQPATATIANARLPNGRLMPANGDLNGDGITDTVNVRIPGQSKIEGIEFEGGIRPVDPLTLTLSGEWVRSRYTGFFPGGALVLNYSGLANLSGKTLFMYPVSKFAFAARWEQPLRESTTWYAQGTATYTGKTYADEANLSWIKPYTLVNASFGLTFARGSVELYGSNLTDYDGWLNGRRNTMADATQSLALVPSRKRVIGLRTTWKF